MSRRRKTREAITSGTAAKIAETQIALMISAMSPAIEPQTSSESNVSTT